MATPTKVFFSAFCACVAQIKEIQLLPRCVFMKHQTDLLNGKKREENDEKDREPEKSEEKANMGQEGDLGGGGPLPV